MKSKEQYYLVKLPFQVKTYLWFGSSKFLIYIFQLIPSILFSSLVVVFLFVGYTKIGLSTKLFADPNFTGLFGTLVGVFVGAFIGGIISLQLHKESLRATSAVKDKEEIYKILYNGLMKFKSDITQTQDKYHTYFTFEMSDPRINTMNPKFTEWDQIKNDSRIIQIPKWLRNIFDHYIQQFSKYRDLLNFARADIIATKEKLIQEVGLKYRVVPGLDESYLVGVMNKNEFYLRHGLNFEGENVEGVDTQDLEQKVINACSLLPSVQQAKYFYDSVLVKNTEEIIFSLELVIQYINNKYENQDDVI